jgi:hypothetical protein
MRDTWYGSGISSKTLDRNLWCADCNTEFDVEAFFDDSGVCDERYACPKCYEYVYYFEDLREKQWEE